MRVNDCLDSTNKLNGNLTQISASDKDEIELLESIAKLLYRVKSVRKTIEILDIISNGRDGLYKEIKPRELEKTFTQESYSGC